jgi:hypothetical protein
MEKYVLRARRGRGVTGRGQINWERADCIGVLVSGLVTSSFLVFRYVKKWTCL